MLINIHKYSINVDNIQHYCEIKGHTTERLCLRLTITLKLFQKCQEYSYRDFLQEKVERIKNLILPMIINRATVLRI